jgi:hypothetical protein
MLEGTIRYYREVAAPMSLIVHSQDRVEVGRGRRSFSRMEFLGEAALTTLFFVQKVAMSLFFLIGTIFTCFQNQYLKHSLYENSKEMKVYLLAIPLGYLGFFFPQTINQKVLQMPLEERVVIRHDNIAQGNRI